MSHTYTNLLTHIVFSTKERLPLITNAIKPELLAYIGGLAKELKGKPIIVNGMNDHVHLLVSLPPTISIAEAMRFIKANSSKWFTQKFEKPFEWQKGYGAFFKTKKNITANLISKLSSFRFYEKMKSNMTRIIFGVEFMPPFSTAFSFALTCSHSLRYGLQI